MIKYEVTLSMDQGTRDFLKGHGYTLYAFKGINAGPGAVSAVWLAITGTDLYDQATITVDWQEDFYVGETTTQMQNGATIGGTNPYTGSGTNPASVALGSRYTYQGTAWDKKPATGPVQDAFCIENNAPQVNNFYVTQRSPDEYIVVQQILGAGGLGTFEPIEVVSMILGTQSEQVGTIVTQAFSPGAIATLPTGATSMEITYNKDSGWTGPVGSFSVLTAGSNVYNEMLNTVD
jgi:hypothetical protein